MKQKSYLALDRANATAEAKNFITLLNSLRNKPQFLSGAFSLTVPQYGIDEDHAYFEYIQQEWNITPCMYGAGHFDVETYKRNYEMGAIPVIHSAPVNANKLMDQRGIQSVMLHYDGIKHYDATNADRDPVVYDNYMAELKKVADLFESFEQNGINVYIYRPFGEMNNSVHEGFFGRTVEGYMAFRNVWRQMCEYFFDVRGLRGLLMSFVPVGFEESIMYYPGDEYVDLFSPTCYSETNTGDLDEFSIRGYEWMLETGKPISISEISVRVSYWLAAPQRGPADWNRLLNSILKYYPEVAFAISWFSGPYTMFPPKDPNDKTQGNYNGLEYMKNPAVLSMDRICPIIKENICFA